MGGSVARDRDGLRIQRHQCTIATPSSSTTSLIGGCLRPRRDNVTSVRAHHRFVVPINLHADERGGDLRFPEFGTHGDPRRGGLLMRSPPRRDAGRRGRRYAFLPFRYDQAGEALLGTASTFRRSRRLHLPPKPQRLPLDPGSPDPPGVVSCATRPSRSPSWGRSSWRGCASKSKPPLTSAVASDLPGAAPNVAPPPEPSPGGIAPGTQADLAATAGDRVYFALDRFDLEAQAHETLTRQATLAWPLPEREGAHRRQRRRAGHARIQCGAGRPTSRGHATGPDRQKAWRAPGSRPYPTARSGRWIPGRPRKAGPGTATPRRCSWASSG